MPRQLLKYNIIFLIFFYSCQSEKDQILETHFKGLSTNGVGVLENCDPNSEVYDILFATSPYELIKDISYVPKSEIAKTIVQIKQENYNHSYIKDIDSLFYKFYIGGDSTLELELLKHYLQSNSRNYSSLENDLEQIEKKIKSLDSKTYLDRYYKIHFLNQKAERCLTINNDMEALSIYNYILGQVENATYLKNGIALDLSNAMLRLLYRDKEYHTILNHLDSTISENNFWAFENYMNKNYTHEDSVEFLYQAKKISKTPLDKYIVNFNLAFYYEVNNPIPDSVEYYYLETIKVFEDTPCNQYKFYPLLYFAQYLNDKQKKQEILNKLNLYKDCNEAIRNNIDFLKHQYIEPSVFTEDIDSMVQLLLLERELANKIYTGKSSLHLQDYFAKNCNNVHSTLRKKKEKLNTDDIKKISKTIYDTRAKEILRIKNSVRYKGTEIENDNNVYSQIEGVLRELNDFKDLRDFKDPIYKNLYELYDKKNQLEKQIEGHSFERSSLDLNLDLFLEKAEKESIKVFNYIAYSEGNKKAEYVGYCYEKNDMKLFSFSQVALDSLGKIILQKINKKEDCNSEIKLIKKILFNGTSFENTEQLIVIPDGIIGQLPLALILGNEEITISQYPNIKHWIDQKPMKMLTSDISIYSYSNQQTINDRSIKIFTDLPYGIGECNEIIDRLALSENSLISGNNLTKQSILSSSEASWLHLSTHAFANTQNRLDNFIAVRDKDGSGDKLYSYELMTMQKPPEVVVLSACDSGVGVHMTGTGVFSVSKAFLAMGTNTVIKTLWKVNDAATKEFMVMFYSFLSDGHTIEEALTLSQKKFIAHSTYSDPYYWAGFVVEGNGQVSFSNN